MKRQNSLVEKNQESSCNVPDQEQSTTAVQGEAADLRKHGTIMRSLWHLPLRIGWRATFDYRLLCSSSLIDPDWYRETYNDVRAAGCDPILHYLVYGAREGRNPSAFFDGVRYLQSNPDVAAADTNPLVHYLRHGVTEGRLFEPVSPKGAPATSVASRLPAGQAVMSPERRLWFFVGDTLEWLRSHSQLTGVGRVSTELFLAALHHVGKPAAIPATWGEASSGWVKAVGSEEISHLLGRLGIPDELAIESADQLTTKSIADSPCSGDHVLFTGLVWTPTFTDLFMRLSAKQIEFSVLVYDIIPIENPELCGQAAHDSFTQWLTTVVSRARTIFVSGDVVRDKILRWATLAGVSISADIVVIPFGMREVANDFSPERLAVDPQTSSVELEDFVLSVGTIDTRKNQLFLCRVWGGLAKVLGVDNVPQLVLAGRDDLGVSSIAEFAPLFAAGKLLVLEGLSDRQLAGLYRSCRFTAFASLSEGYGLPVAESLLYGKLCLSSDLPVVREHARDLARYFSATDLDSAISRFEEILASPAAQAAAERRIRKHFHPTSWAESYGLLVTGAASLDTGPLAITSRGTPDATFPGAGEISVPDALIKSSRWCRAEGPDVSIVIINWNSLAVTLECIRQVWAATDRYTYEIIIADNGSAPHEADRLRRLGKGIRVLELGCNRFFGEANNIAAEHARGRYLCFLNSDAFVSEGWLSALLRPLEEDPAVGATGPMFLFPDGTIQEAGARIDSEGYPVRLGRFEKTLSAESLTPKFVDYVSAAALIVPQDLFNECGGFDLCYEPAYYEDVDLCFKIQALGRKILYCPDARITHIEGNAANDNSTATARKKHWGDLNRAKFVARWGDYLRARRQETLPALADGVLPRRRAPLVSEGPTVQSTATAAIYTPYNLTPGGGESYLLTCATVLASTYNVKLVTPHPYSRLRLANLGVELGLDLSAIEPVTEAEFLKQRPPDLMLTMGNHMIPPIAGYGGTNLYLCQFPFQIEKDRIQENRFLLDNYRQILVYSEYVKAHLYAGLSAERLPSKPMNVMPPAVQQIGGAAGKATNRILSVGRFFVGGHSKRQDALIEVFKSLVDRLPQTVELHLAGSSIPEPQHMDYLAQLFETAHGYPIVFHVNPSMSHLHQLYREATLYWHGTGIGADLAVTPEKAEHFGISIVEAMSAYAIPLALASGGPREIIDHGEDGFLYDTPAELARLTISLFDPEAAEWRRCLSRAAARKASEFSRDRFGERFRLLVTQLVEATPSPAIVGR